MERQIVIWPDPILKRTASKVEIFDEKLTQLVVDMHQTVYQKGLGLAAPQIGISKRIIVYNIDHAEGHMINPEITSMSDDKIMTKEGCLSFPAIYIEVERAKEITVQYQDTDGDTHTGQFESFVAVCIQHEIDHLDGKNIIDRESKLKRDIITGKMKKLKRQLDEARKSSTG